MYNLLELIVWGRKSKTYKRLTHGKRKVTKSHVVISERNWLKLAGKLSQELPRDEAISVVNLIKQYAN